MGIAANITATAFPEQGPCLGRRVSVCFHYDTTQQVQGTIVRDDMQEPGRTIIRLDDGRYVLSTECHYSLE